MSTDSDHKKYEKDLLTRLIEMEPYANIGRMAGGLAHNLQSPLTAIKGYSQLIQVDHGRIEELDLILKEVQQIQNVTHHLLGKIRHLHDRSKKTILLNDIIGLELEFLKSNLNFKHRIKKHIQLDPELPVFEAVYADISQILLNLLLNAIDAMVETPEKELTILTRHDATHIYVEIHDTGPGIPPDQMKKIRQPLFTTKPGLSEIQDDKTPAGAGVGLSAVTVLLEKAGGEMDIRSDTGGTAVTVRFPYSAPEDKIN